MKKLKEMTEAAKIPEHRINKPQPLLRDMPVGETWYVGFTALMVIAGRCYLSPDEQRRARPGATISVRRDEHGYHVVVSDPALEFLEWNVSPEKLIPVATFTETVERK